MKRILQLWLALTVTTAGCDDPVSSPATGAVRVEVATSGLDADTSGYVFIINDSLRVQLPTAGDTTVILPSGLYTTTLSHVPMNCSPRDGVNGTVTVRRDTAVVQVAITCEPTFADKLVYGSIRNGRLSLYVANLDGSNVRSLSDTENGWFPSISPDGTWLAIGTTSDSLIVINASGTERRFITRGRMPEWSPDGSKLVYMTQDDVWVINRDGTGNQNLTNSFHWDAWPTWSPDGTRIAFQSLRNGKDEIFVMNADGSNIRSVSAALNAAGHPRWSRTSDLIAFEGSNPGDGGWRIHIVNPDGTALRRLPGTVVGDYTPAWLPDGTSMVVARTASTEGLYIIRPNGLRAQLLRDAFLNTAPTIGPKRTFSEH